MHVVQCRFVAVSVAGPPLEILTWYWSTAFGRISPVILTQFHAIVDIWEGLSTEVPTLPNFSNNHQIP